jgi:hypothetical protein
LGQSSSSALIFAGNAVHDDAYLQQDFFLEAGDIVFIDIFSQGRDVKAPGGHLVKQVGVSQYFIFHNDLHNLFLVLLARKIAVAYQTVQFQAQTLSHSLIARTVLRDVAHKGEEFSLLLLWQSFKWQFVSEVGEHAEDGIGFDVCLAIGSDFSEEVSVDFLVDAIETSVLAVVVPANELVYAILLQIIHAFENAVCYHSHLRELLPRKIKELHAVQTHSHAHQFVQRDRTELLSHSAQQYLPDLYLRGRIVVSDRKAMQ